MASLNQNADPEFVRIIQASLTYWLKRIEKFDDAQIEQLDQDSQNLYRLITFGLSHVDTVKLASELCLGLFDYTYSKGAWLEWIDFLESVVKKLPLERNTLLYAQMLHKLGFLYYLMNKGELIDKTLSKATILAKNGNSKELLATIYITQSQYKLGLRELDLAEHFCQKAVKILEKLDNVAYQKARAFKVLGIINQTQGFLAESIDYQKQALSLLQGNGWFIFESQILIDLAHSFIQNEQYSEANECFDQALNILEPTNLEMMKSAVHINRGLLYSEQNQVAEAEEAYLLANSNYLRNSQNYEYRAVVTSNLGWTYFDQKDYEKASHFFEESIDIWRLTCSNLRLANALSNYIELLLVLDQDEEALSLWEEAIEIVKRYSEDKKALELMGELNNQKEQIDRKIN